MTDTDFIDTDIEKAEHDLERLSGMVRSCIMLNASATLTEEAYTQQYTDLTRRYEEKKAEYESLLDRKKAMEATAVVFSGILFRLTELDEIPTDFDVCPKCGQSYKGRPALSREDNKTLICPDCGTREALATLGVSEEEQESILNAIHRYNSELIA